MESDAEWIDVDSEFPRHTQRPPVSRPTPPTDPRPRTRPPVIEPPHDAPERAPSSPRQPVGSNAGVVAGCVGGALGVVLMLLVVYMLVLRRRLTKAKKSGRAAHYQLRVEDVAHLSHLDETTNTYVNTTDLQKLVASVRAKGKSENRLPTLPRLNHQTPAPYRPTATPGDNDTFQGDAVVVRAPMPPPYTASTPPFQPQPHVEPQPVQEVIYSNLEECVAPPRPAPRREPPKTAPPPPPTKEPSSPVSQPVRPAPAPPKSSSPSPTNNSSTPPQTVKPVPPCPSLKPSKVGPAVQAKPGAKPTPPTLPKPGKGKALPPLKMVLRGATEGASSDSCATPDTAIIHLSPEATPTGEGTPGTASISAKIALLEGHMRTAGGGVPRPGLVRP
ncbi:caskin-1-like [Portunus trituberculatus]|uniref:caskin-1-like n=1 Tax=Portunus trituberculatus TaxID=210409 RepID=UPI001E1CE422|nr:caskin-1-like [Portunus trituberculatus]